MYDVGSRSNQSRSTMSVMMMNATKVNIAPKGALILMKARESAASQNAYVIRLQSQRHIQQTTIVIVYAFASPRPEPCLIVRRHELSASSRQQTCSARGSADPVQYRTSNGYLHAGASELVFRCSHEHKIFSVLNTRTDRYTIIPKQHGSTGKPLGTDILVCSSYRGASVNT